MSFVSQRMPLYTAFALSLALNSAIFLSAHRSFGSQAQWQPQKALELVARNRARKIEIEFVEAPVQKPLRKPERTRKIAARDSLAQDLGKLKSNATPTPAIAKLGPSDQLSQRRLEDQMAPPKASIPKEPTEADEAAVPAIAGDAASWLPIKSATMEKKIDAPKKTEQDIAEEKALEQAAAVLSADKITTMEMAVKRSSGAPFHGVTSFEATGSGMGVYMKNLKDRIWLEWFPYIAFRYPVTFETADAVIRFMVGKQGEVRSVEVVSYRGSPMFATFCTQVVRRAGGFGPLPKDLLAMMGKDELEIKFAFHYR